MKSIDMSFRHRWQKALSAKWQRWQRRQRRFIDLYIKNRSLRWVERFMLGWMAVFVLILGLTLHQNSRLDEHYLTAAPEDGGQFREGIVGEIESINPVFSGDRSSRSAEALLFSSLFTYDGSGSVEKDLAQAYELEENRTVYRVTIRDDVRWHDGEPLTADDIVFTFQSIQDPEVESSLRARWEGIEIEATDEHTVIFRLPNPYAPFLHQLTTGIIPEHQFEDIAPERLRISSFNQNPIGSGPFVFDRITPAGQIYLHANQDYYGRPPRLDEFMMAVYPDQESMVEAYNRSEINSMITDSNFNTGQLKNADRSLVERLDMASQVFAFFNTERLDDVNTRRALDLSVNTESVTNHLGPNYRHVTGPLLEEHIGFLSLQDNFDIETASKLMEAADWERNGDDNWERDGEVLELELFTQTREQYRLAAEQLQEQWSEFGVIVHVSELDSSQLQQERITPRDYDVLLLGISLDNDPDVYGYWHSSQTGDAGRNLSQYSSEGADINLEDGRTRSDEELRAAKYGAFQSQWAEDVPALALYRPQNYYVYRREVHGMEVEDTNIASMRFHNVEDWTINTAPGLQRLYPKMHD